MRILLFGKGGQVGWELQRSLMPLGEVLALDRSGAAGLCGDLADPDGIAATMRAVKPDVVVNAAAYTAVDKAESEPELAHTINAEAPGAMAREAERLGAWVVHYSTDYVFDGRGERPWREDDTCAPLNAYGASKRAGELAVEACTRRLVLRTSWVYAVRGANFLRTMLRLGAERDQLRVVADQIGTPTSAVLIADVTARALQHPAALSGTWHLTANGETSWHGFAEAIFDEAKARGLIVRRPKVLPITTAEYRTKAQRPAYSRLDTARLQADLGIVLPDWREGLVRVMDELAAASKT